MLRILGLISGLVALLTVLSSTTLAREWTDASGRFKFQGDFVASGETMVILQRDNKQKDLVAIDIDQLSKADQTFIEEKTANAKDNPELRTYTTRSGFKVRAAVVRFINKTVEIYRHRGKVYVNGTQIDKLPGIYRRIVTEVVNHFEGTNLDSDSLSEWVKELGGKKKRYECDGVLAELENGDHYAVPFFLLSEADRKYLQPGFEEWSAENADEKTKEEYSMQMRAQAMAAHQKEQQTQDFVKLHLLLTGVQAGLTDLWEVALIPVKAGGIPRSVVVPGRDSRQAAAFAVSKFPGYRAGAARPVTNARF